MTLKELLEARAKAAARIEQLRAGLDAANRDKPPSQWVDFTAEETAQWEAANTEFDSLTRRIALEQQAERVKAANEAVANTPPPVIPISQGGKSRKNRPPVPQAADYNAAITGWCRYQQGIKPTKDQLRAAEVTGLRPGRRYLDINFNSIDIARNNFHAALSAQTGAAGAYTIPAGFINNLEVALLAYGSLLQVVDIMDTDTGAPFSWPTANDTGNKGVRVAENDAAATNTQDPVTGLVTWYAHKYTSKLVKVPVELMDDAAFDIPTFLGSALGERLGRVLNDECTTGTGQAMPTGIVTAASAGVTTAGGSAITADELIDCMHSLDIAYRQQAGWMFNDVTAKLVRKLKYSGTGEYVWMAGGSFAGGFQPDTLLNKPVCINLSMDDPTTGKIPVLFGAFKKYKIRRVRGIRLRRLVERYADADQEGFVAFMRADGHLLDAGTAPVRKLTMA